MQRNMHVETTASETVARWWPWASLCASRASASGRFQQGALGGIVTTGLVGLTVIACQGPSNAVPDRGHLLLQAPGPLPEPALRQTVYVPVYSSIYQGLGIRMEQVELTATVSVRNVSATHPLVLTYVRYYDSHGAKLRDYIDGPGELGPLATVEFVVERADTAGGPGANFLVQWLGPPDIDAPLIEAVMIGQAGNAGISFTSAGRAITNEPPN